MRLHSWAMVLGLLLGGPAAATPPDIIDLRDELFGISRDKILLIRTATDNLGQYFAERRTVYLVEIDRQTFAETLRPIYSFDRREDFDDALRKPVPILDVTRASEAVDPYAVLAELDGRPVSLADGAPRELAKIITEEGELVISLPDDRQIRAPLDTLRDRMIGSTDALAKVMADYPRLAPVTVSDLLTDRISPDESCDFEDAFDYQDWLGPELVMIRMTCSVDQMTSLLLPLRP